jgi:hypothetical protein
MKKNIRCPWRLVQACVVAAGLLVVPSIFGQTYVMDGAVLSAGGGVSTGGVFSVSGAVGQGVVTSAKSGDYELQTGFWSWVVVVQTPSAPRLSVTSSNGFAVLTWPVASGQFLLEQSQSVTAPPASWSVVPLAYSTNNNVISVTAPLSHGVMFYRLRKTD